MASGNNVNFRDQTASSSTTPANRYGTQRSYDPPQDQDLPVASNSGYHLDSASGDPKQSSKGNDSYKQQRSIDPDDLTCSVVDELKYQIQNNQNTKGLSIERLVADIRRKQNPEQFDINKWKTNLPSDIKQCRDSTLRSVMAYGDEPSQVASVLKAKIDKESSNEDPIATSLDNIIEPLRDLQKDLNEMSSLNLFRAILDIGANQIDRADRMFYSEAYHLVKNLEDYTFDNAHDQVQAIRLMHYESDDKDELVDFIDKHRIFEDAYPHLQRLAKKRATNSNLNTTTQNQNNNQPRRTSIIRQVSQDGNNNANRNDTGLTNTARPGSSSGKNSVRN